MFLKRICTFFEQKIGTYLLKRDFLLSRKDIFYYLKPRKSHNSENLKFSN